MFFIFYSLYHKPVLSAHSHTQKEIKTYVNIIGIMTFSAGVDHRWRLEGAIKMSGDQMAFQDEQEELILQLAELEKVTSP